MDDQDELGIRSILPQIIEEVYSPMPPFFRPNDPSTFRADFMQDWMWNVIGDGILPWIPQTFTFFRRLRRKVRLGVSMFLVDHVLIEVEEDW